MIVKLTRAQVKQIKPFYDAVLADKAGCMVVAQLGAINGEDAPLEMRVGFITAEKAAVLQKVAISDIKRLPSVQPQGEKHE